MYRPPPARLARRGRRARNPRGAAASPPQTGAARSLRRRRRCTSAPPSWRSPSGTRRRRRTTRRTAAASTSRPRPAWAVGAAGEGPRPASLVGQPAAPPPRRRKGLVLHPGGRRVSARVQTRRQVRQGRKGGDGSCLEDEISVWTTSAGPSARQGRRQGQGRRRQGQGARRQEGWQEALKPPRGRPRTRPRADASTPRARRGGAAGERPCTHAVAETTASTFPSPPVPDDARPTPPRMTDPHRFSGTRGHDQATLVSSTQDATR